MSAEVLASAVLQDKAGVECFTVGFFAFELFKECLACVLVLGSFRRICSARNGMTAGFKIVLKPNMRSLTPEPKVRDCVFLKLYGPSWLTIGGEDR